MPSVKWPEAHLARALEHWANGLSGRDVATRVNAEFSTRYTRNAIIGQVHRHGTQQHRQSRITLSRDQLAKRRGARVDIRFARKKPVPPQAHKRRSVLESLPATPLPPRRETDIARVSFMALEPHHCRFIPGEAKDLSLDAPLYCGERKVPGLSYCEVHARRCHRADGVPAPEVAPETPKEKVMEFA